MLSTGHRLAMLNGSAGTANVGQISAPNRLDERLQKNDRNAWTSAYLAVDRAGYPNIWQIRTDLPEVRDDDIFETILSFVIAGLVQRAPHRCPCARHAPAADGAPRG